MINENNRDESLVNADKIREDDIEVTLRPHIFNEFVGQKQTVDNLQIFIEAAKRRKEPLDHVLLTGPPGLGKTTLSYIISKEMETSIKVTSGPVLAKPGDLAGILTSLEEGDVLFIDEIHRLSAIVEEYLYSAMEEYRLDILIDSGPSARTLQIALPQFTLVGATTRAGLLTAPLRSRFKILFRLDYYNVEDLVKIVKRSASILKVPIQNDGATEIASRARGTPRIANRLLRRTRDFADVKGNGTITLEIAQMALTALDVDEFGLDDMDKRILMTIIDKYNGGPVGVNTIAVGVGEEPDTIEEVYEPYLVQQGFLKRTSRGRVATELCYKHFGMNLPKSGYFEMF